MPTRGRKAWAAQALACFLRQTYAAKNLFIVDDREDPSFPDGAPYPNVAHLLIADRQSIPAKRNIAAGLANGEILWHLDSDDWSSPERMADQVRRLEESGKAVTGYHSLLFYSETELMWGRYKGATNYALGSSLCYWKSFWKDHPFHEDKKIGEDNEFVFAAANEGQLISVDGEQCMVARVHPDNTSRKDMGGFSPVSPGQTPAGFFL